MLGRPGGDFLPARQVAEVRRQSERQVLDDRRALRGRGEFRVRRAIRPLARRAQEPRRAWTAASDYVACFVFDMTEMKRRETEAEEARQRLAIVLESLPAGVVIYDRDDKFVLANRKLQDTLPALKPAWQPGLPLPRGDRARPRSSAISASSGDPEIDSALRQPTPTPGSRPIWRRHHVRHTRLERRNPDGRWFQVYRHAHRRRHLHRRARRHHRDQGARKGAAQKHAPDRALPPCARRTAGRGLRQVARI